MNTRIVKWIVIWNVSLTILLLASLAGNAAWVQAANDPPIRAYTANLEDVGGDGTSVTTDDIISTTTPDVLVGVTTTNLSVNHPHICIVTASAGAVHLGDGTYTFGLSQDEILSTVAASDRIIELFDNAGINDDSYEEVSTTYAFTGVSGEHTFYFSARKRNAGDGDILVSASSITVVCMKKVL